MEQQQGNVLFYTFILVRPSSPTPPPRPRLRRVPGCRDLRREARTLEGTAVEEDDADDLEALLLRARHAARRQRARE
jgi:hypothetical protein